MHHKLNFREDQPKVGSPRERGSEERLEILEYPTALRIAVI